MDVHRFIIKAYPTEDHPEFHVWQKATLVLFIGNADPYAAEKFALDELKRRGWVPEAFERKDTLIRQIVREQGGDVWNAYVQAEKGNIFWREELESLPMCKKAESLWCTGPKLAESFVDTLIEESGGHRLTAEEAGEFREKNADYILGSYVLELKQFVNEGLSVETRQRKIGELFLRSLEGGPVRNIDPYTLSDKDFDEYWEIVGVPIQKRVKAASKQVKTSIARLGKGKYEGGLILLNTGYLTVPHDFLVAMAKRYASKDTSSIKHVIVISSWTITNGFDTTVNYGFYPHEPETIELQRLRNVFWETVEKLMTKSILEGGALDSGSQQVMSPIHFNYKGEVLTFGVPQLESSLKPDKN